MQYTLVVRQYKEHRWTEEKFINCPPVWDMYKHYSTSEFVFAGRAVHYCTPQHWPTTSVQLFVHCEFADTNMKEHKTIDIARFLK